LFKTYPILTFSPVKMCLPNLTLPKVPSPTEVPTKVINKKITQRVVAYILRGF